jgi:hypothetical protein
MANESVPAPWWLKMQARGLLTAQDVERRVHAVQRAARLYSVNPAYVARAAKDEWYWHKFINSRAEW